jgi:DNA invertase Pin-like site-specific DNA recombinase
MSWCVIPLLALLSSLAKVEAQKISERTKAGMARAKAKGIKIGLAEARD